MGSRNIIYWFYFKLFKNLNKQLEEFASNLGQIKRYKEERTMSENVGKNVYFLTTRFDIDECCFAETI